MNEPVDRKSFFDVGIADPAVSLAAAIVVTIIGLLSLERENDVHVCGSSTPVNRRRVFLFA